MKTSATIFSCNSVCYEGIQRVFRNSMVAYVRVRLTETFPADHLNRLKHPLKADWQSLVENSARSRAIGGTETEVIDEYDLLDVGHLFNIFDIYYDKLFSSGALEKHPYPKPGKARLLGNLKSIKDSRDPLSHPVDQEVSYEEAIGVLVDAKQVLQSLGLEEAAKQVAALMRALPQNSAAFEEIEDPKHETLLVLPTEDSIYYDFIGRQEVLTSLGEWFSQRQNKRCLLAGDGGKGKSAVAYKFALKLSETSKEYRLIAWMSAKQRKFQEGATVTIDAPDFVDLESAVDRLLMHYGLLPKDVSRVLDEKQAKLIELLNDSPAFLVIDDIDTVLADQEVVAFFTFDVPMTKSAVLLTSRRDIPGIKTLTVKGFELPEGINFIASRVELYDLDAGCCPSPIAHKVVEATDGSPLYIDDLMRLAKVLPLPQAVAMWKEKKGDEARRYALQREMEKLSVDARKVLIAACISEEPISFPELSSVLAVSEDRIVTALTELQTLFLFPKPRIVEGEQRFALNTNTRKLVKLVEGSTDQYSRLEVASRAIFGKLPDIGKGEIPTLLRQAYLRTTSGRFAEAESLLLAARKVYPHNPEVEGFLGFVYRRWDRFTDATKHFEEAWRLKSKNRETYKHWVRMEMTQHEWTAAIAAADKALKLIPDFIEMIALRAECKVRSGTDLNRRLQREKAFKLWEECSAELKQSLKDPEKLASGEREYNAAMYKTLVICLDCLGDLRGLVEWFHRWEKEHPDDTQVLRQREFLQNKRGVAIEELGSIKREFQVSSRPRPF